MAARAGASRPSPPIAPSPGERRAVPPPTDARSKSATGGPCWQRARRGNCQRSLCPVHRGRDIRLHRALSCQTPNLNYRLCPLTGRNAQAITRTSCGNRCQWRSSRAITTQRWTLFPPHHAVQHYGTELQSDLCLAVYWDSAPVPSILFGSATCRRSPRSRIDVWGLTAPRCCGYPKSWIMSRAARFHQ